MRYKYAVSNLKTYGLYDINRRNIGRETFLYKKKSRFIRRSDARGVTIPNYQRVKWSKSA